jgi:uncharacterized protein YuzE
MNFTSILTSILLLFSAHPLHVSVSEINFDEKDKSLEIMTRIFIDDAESTLRKTLAQPDLDILKPKTNNTDQLLKDYLLKHFAISLDNKPQKINYLGHEVDGEAFILYIEVQNVKKFKTIEVKNDIFMEFFDDQSNIINVTVRGTVHSLRLTNNSPTDKLSFDSK